ncbi:MAG: acetyl-CoA carboxylase carboxyltransferase subunit alpha [Alphaproteobacteria bacterium]
MRTYLDFEQNIAELEGKISELRHMSNNGDMNIASELEKLEEKSKKLISDTYSNLDDWQIVKVARHPDRPHFVDYVNEMIEDFTPLSGDRKFSEDKALIAGFGRFRGRTVAIMGQEKGHDTESRMKHNFGSARPEGYRKAQRIMDMADKFGIPVISLVDTAGAYPGVGAEERGQAEAIASGIDKCLSIKVPFVSVVIGEGGSGGAIAIAAADRVYMLENSIYSVISPEGCATILWRSADYSEQAARALKMTSKNLMEFGVIDGIISEPLGGAQRDKKTAINSVADTIEAALNELESIPGDKLVEQRAEKFLKIGR